MSFILHETSGREQSPARTWRLLIEFAVLQTLDVLTTLLFLSAGAAEGNPFVNWMMGAAGHPAGGLATAKAMAMPMGIFCQLTGRFALLRRVNGFYRVLVAWNIAAAILARFV